MNHTVLRCTNQRGREEGGREGGGGRSEGGREGAFEYREREGGFTRVCVQ